MVFTRGAEVEWGSSVPQQSHLSFICVEYALKCPDWLMVVAEWGHRLRNKVWCVDGARALTDKHALHVCTVCLLQYVFLKFILCKLRNHVAGRVLN